MDLLYLCAAEAMAKMGEFASAKHFMWKAYSQCGDAETRVQILEAISKISKLSKE